MGFSEGKGFMCNSYRKYFKYFPWKKYSLGFFGYIFTDFTKLDNTLKCFFFRKQMLQTKISFHTKFISLRLKLCTIMVMNYFHVKIHAATCMGRWIKM